MRGRCARSFRYPLLAWTPFVVARIGTGIFGYMKSSTAIACPIELGVTHPLPVRLDIWVLFGFLRITNTTNFDQ